MLTKSDQSFDPVHVIGATGRSGAALCQALQTRGIPVVPLVRSLDKWQATGLAGTARVIELSDHFSLSVALKDAMRVVSCAHARHTRALVEASPRDALMVLLGSTRRYTRWPDAHGLGVLEGERVFLGSGRPGVMLHPTMIYGATGENNVQRLAALLRRLPFVPLPQAGKAGATGALVQPIFQTDLTRCIIAALERNWPGPRTLVVAGPTALPYDAFVRAVAQAAGLPPPRIVPVPAWLLQLAAPFTRLVPGLPTVTGDEIRRLTEDKAFDVMPMFNQLGITPRPLATGLALTFGGARGGASAGLRPDPPRAEPLEPDR